MLLAHDDAIPQRDRLLDCGEMRGRLQRRLRMDAGAVVRAIRIKYRPSESLRVVYRVSDDNATLVTARTFPPSTRAANAAHAQADAIAWGAGSPVFDDPELGAVFWTFPNDRRLRGVERLLAPDEELRSRVPGWVSSELAGYAPEKCVVIACLDVGRRPVGFAKLFADALDGERACALHRAIAPGFRRADDVAIPQVIDWDRAHHTMFLEPAAGRRMADLPVERWPHALRRLGRAVARVHASPIPAAVPPLIRTTADHLREAARLVGRAQPNLKHSALLIAAELAARLRHDHEAVLLHGDLHLKNAFVDCDRLSLIDVDQAARGPAAADLGSLVAALHTRDTTLATHFLEGYAAVRPLPPASALAWHTAASLLGERAVRAITRVRVPVLRNLAGMLDEAQRLALAAGIQP